MMEDEVIKGRRFIFWSTGFLGVALILSGLFFLLINFNIIPGNDFILNRVLGILFFVVGFVFAFFQGAGGGLFWFVFPAGFLFSMGVVTLIMGITSFFEPISMSIFSCGIGTTFVVVFLLRNNHWWTLLPAGILFGLCSWILLYPLQPVIGYHPIFLLFWIGLSFLCIYVFSVQKKKLRFSLYTGLIILFISFIYYFTITLYEWELLWAVLLTLLGIALPAVIIYLDKKKKP